VRDVAGTYQVPEFLETAPHVVLRPGAEQSKWPALDIDELIRRIHEADVWVAVEHLDLASDSVTAQEEVVRVEHPDETLRVSSRYLRCSSTCVRAGSGGARHGTRGSPAKDSKTRAVSSVEASSTTNHLKLAAPLLQDACRARKRGNGRSCGTRQRSSLAALVDPSTPGASPLWLGRAASVRPTTYRASVRISATESVFSENEAAV
jgi:hypothetical protein